MNKILKRILLIEILVISLFTIGNLVYTFNSLKFTVLNKVILFSITIILVLIVLNYLIKSFTNKPWKAIITVLIIIGYSFVLIQANNILFAYNGLTSKMGASAKYTTTLVAKKDGKYTTLDSIDSNTKIGIQATNKSYANGSFALQEITKLDKTDNISQYTSTKKAYDALMKNNVDMITVSDLSDLKDYDPNFSNNFVAVQTFTSNEKSQASDKDITTTPFTILVSGIDSRSSKIDDGGNGDSNIIVTFNPKTGHITTLTTPRDSYVPLKCNNGATDKLTHAASYGGTTCVKETLESIYDIKIDYTIRINFVGMIDIVNALGGIDINVPINAVNAANGKTEVCEQNSRGVKGTICWEEGKTNKMDGETALAFARNRYNQDGGDFYRGRNQQIVIEAIIKKAAKINNIGTVSSLLGAVSAFMVTDLDKDDILSLYDIVVGLENNINIEKLYIGGTTGMVGAMSVVYPDSADLKYAEYRMKVNLDEARAQFPTNGYYVDGNRPTNDDGNNPLRKEKMPFNGTIEPEITNKKK